MLKKKLQHKLAAACFGIGPRVSLSLYLTHNTGIKLLSLKMYDVYIFIFLLICLPSPDFFIKSSVYYFFSDYIRQCIAGCARFNILSHLSWYETAEATVNELRISHIEHRDSRLNGSQYITVP